MKENPKLLKFLLRYRIVLAAVVNATVFGLLRGQMNMWLAALIAASLFGMISTLPTYWEERLRKNVATELTSDASLSSK